MVQVELVVMVGVVFFLVMYEQLFLFVMGMCCGYCIGYMKGMCSNYVLRCFFGWWGVQVVYVSSKNLVGCVEDCGFVELVLDLLFQKRGRGGMRQLWSILSDDGFLGCVSVIFFIVFCCWV